MSDRIDRGGGRPYLPCAVSRVVPPLENFINENQRPISREAAHLEGACD